MNIPKGSSNLAYHSALCSLQVDIFVTGYPCVSLSSLNVCPEPFEKAEAKTVSGYHAAMGYIEKQKPVALALENVRQMLQRRKQDDYQRPLDIQNKKLSNSYICVSVLANSCDFGLPQSRNRVWMLYLRKDQCICHPRDLESDMLFPSQTYYDC